MLAEEEGLLHTLEIPTVGWPLGTPPWLASDPFHPIMPRPVSYTHLTLPTIYSV